MYRSFFDKRRQKEVLDAAKAGKPLPPRGVAKPLAEKPARNPIAPERQAELDRNLWAAVGLVEFEKIEESIDAGADVDARGEEGETPLMFACRCGHEDLMRILVSKGADLNAEDERGCTALGHLAGRRETVLEWEDVYNVRTGVSLIEGPQREELDKIDRMENLLKKFGAKGDFE